VWVYEIVPGAMLTGSSTPGAIVSITLELGTPSGRVLVWGTRARVGATGTFRLRVPYSTRGGPQSAFLPLGPYRVQTLEDEIEVEVDEASIRGGREVPVAPIDHEAGRSASRAGLDVRIRALADHGGGVRRVSALVLASRVPGAHPYGLCSARGMVGDQRSTGLPSQEERTDSIWHATI
jgi:hypothetical protein